jgi:hypothetical protein
MQTLSLSLRLAALIALTALAACGGDEQEDQGPQLFDFKLDVQAVDGSGKPVVKAPVMLDGNTIGFTDKDGRFLALLKEEQGTEVTLASAPPDGYVKIAESTVTTKLKVRQDSSGAITGDTVSLPVTFEAAKHQHLVWVMLTCGEDLPAGACADLEIKNGDDELVATTDPFGRAHFLVDGSPGKVIDLTVDTRRPPAEGSAPYVLEPVEPTFHIDFDRDPEVFLVKQTFTNRVVEAAPVKKTKSTVRSNSRPKTIKKPTKPVTKPKEKKKDGPKAPIPIF